MFQLCLLTGCHTGRDVKVKGGASNEELTGEGKYIAESAA